MAAHQCQFDGCAGATMVAPQLGESGADVDPVAGQQGDAIALVVSHRPGQQVAQHHGRGFELITEQPIPGAARGLSQAELEEQFEMIVIGGEHPVVQRLSVVRVGSVFEQQPSKRERVRMRRILDARRRTRR